MPRCPVETGACPVAQALVEGLTLVTTDAGLAGYPGAVRVV
jgi:hypothetical protein